MESVERSNGVSKTTEKILDELDDDQKSEVVREIGDVVVRGIQEDGSESFAKKVGHAVIDEIPLLGRFFLVKAGAARTVDVWLERNSDAVVEAVGDVVVEEVVDSHAGETVDSSVGAVVDRMGEETS